MHPGSTADLWARAIPGVVLVLVAVYCWAAAALRPFTVPIEAAIALPILGMALAAAAGWRTSRPPVMEESPPEVPVTWSDAWPWLALFAGLAGWEMAAYLSSPRRDHPTLSSMVGVVLDSHPGRAMLIGVWLSLGWAVFLRSGSRAGPATSAPAPPPDRANPPSRNRP